MSYRQTNFLPIVYVFIAFPLETVREEWCSLLINTDVKQTDKRFTSFEYKKVEAFSWNYSLSGTACEELHFFKCHLCNNRNEFFMELSLSGTVCEEWPIQRVPTSFNVPCVTIEMNFSWNYPFQELHAKNGLYSWCPLFLMSPL